MLWFAWIKYVWIRLTTIIGTGDLIKTWWISDWGVQWNMTHWMIYPLKHRHKGLTSDSVRCFNQTVGDQRHEPRQHEGGEEQDAKGAKLFNPTWKGTTMRQENMGRRKTKDWTGWIFMAHGNSLWETDCACRCKPHAMEFEWLLDSLVWRLVACAVAFEIASYVLIVSLLIM